jgi:peptidyl-dipeptidase Dcp
MLTLPVTTLASSHNDPEDAMVVAADNPLLNDWTGPHGGIPPFDQVALEHFEPAFQAAMAERLAEIDAIANGKGKATFDNTIAALERSGGALERLMTIYGVWGSTLSSAEFRELEGRIEPQLAALGDQVVQNSALFSRIADVFEGKKFRKLTEEQQRLTWKIYNRFVRSGAKLDETAKARLAEINQELAARYTRFSQNLLADEETWVVIDDASRLSGLPAGLVSAMAADASSRDLEGKWVVVNTRSSVQPFLEWADDRELREVVWKAFVDRGDRGGETDNNALVGEILSLRAERATLLGYDTHAHWRLEMSMAGGPDAAMKLMEAVWKPAVGRVAEEVAAQQAVADAEGAGITIAPWDYRYYQEKVRKDKYDLDQNEVKAYLQLEKLREGMFWMARELYGLTFTQITDVPVYHPDVRVWRVDTTDGNPVGLWYFDPYARPGKRSGAWMNAYRPQSRFDGDDLPIVSNNSNFVKGAPGTPVLISWDDAETMFHEFGHALHGLLSDVTYPSLAGTNVFRDYVEFPSQLHERWLGTPEVLQTYAVHVETGEPMPQALIERIDAAATFNSGFGTVEYLASALIDMKLHLAGATPIDADAFERETLSSLGMPAELVMRHRTPQFAHVFSGDGYSAGYYSYLWADAITADAAEAFVEAGSMWDPTTARSLVEHVLSVGNTIDPAEAFRAFRGRDVDVSALMRARGFAE